MSYTDPCRGDCGANHWPDCTPECSSMQPPTPQEIERAKINYEFQQKKFKEGGEICKKESKHDWMPGHIIYTCKRCGESTDY